MKKTKSKINFAKIAVRTAGVSTGAVGSEILINKVAPTVNRGIKGAVVLVGGAVVSSLPMKSGEDFVHGLGDGMIAVGAINITKALAPKLVSPTNPDAEKVEGFEEEIIDTGIEGLEEGLAGDDNFALTGLEEGLAGDEDFNIEM